MSLKSPPPASSGPLMKNAANAPLIYFDNAPVRGSVNGGIEVELTARYLAPKADGNVAVEIACVAHLRCTPQSAALLIDSLKHAIELAKQQQELLGAALPPQDYVRERQSN
jgi:hypothetical protein